MTSRRAALWGALLVAGWGAPAAPAASWSAPFRLSSPRAADLSPSVAAVSAGGQVAVAFSVYEEENPASAQAYLALGSRAGRGARGLRVLRVPGAQAVLDLAFSGERLELLTGSSPARLTCCSKASVVGFAGGRFGAPRRVRDGLTGVTVGRLVVAGKKVVGAIATERGVWEGGGRRLSSLSAVPWTLAAAPGAVGWIEASDHGGEQGARRIVVALGSRRPRVLLGAGAGHELNELALAPGAGTALSAAWIDSWFDGSGAYHAQAVVADVAGALRPRPLPVAGQAASGLAFAGGAAGEQVLAFKSCDANGSCWVRAAFRDPRGRFGAPVQLGAMDASQEPAAALAADGSAVVAWVSGGHVFAVRRAAHAVRPERVREVSATNYASDLSVASGAGGLNAVAVWTQGTLNPDVVAAALRRG